MGRPFLPNGERLVTVVEGLALRAAAPRSGGATNVAAVPAMRPAPAGRGRIARSASNSTSVCFVVPSLPSNCSPLRIWAGTPGCNPLGVGTPCAPTQLSGGTPRAARSSAAHQRRNELLQAYLAPVREPCRRTQLQSAARCTRANCSQREQFHLGLLRRGISPVQRFTPPGWSSLYFSFNIVTPVQSPSIGWRLTSSIF